jgi:hypothetical protein
MMLRCPNCRTRVPVRWLMLAPPWGRHPCATCGSLISGTVLRTVVTSAVVFVLGILVIGAVKGRTNPLVLVPAVAVTLAVFLLDLPRQLKAEPGGARE